MVLPRCSLKQLFQIIPRNYPECRFFKNKIANIPSISLNEKINLPQMLSLTFKTLGEAQNSFFCCLVMFGLCYSKLCYSKHFTNYDLFPMLRHLHLSPPTFKKTKKPISQITCYIYLT